jgi:SAM-dependent methyltransferase
MILNVGCGDNKVEGAVNLDGYWNPKADLHFDLEHCGVEPKKPQIDSRDKYDSIYMTHVIEHITRLLPLMEELWNVAKPGAKLYITCPHGASDDADEDPTHVRRMFPTSFMAFAQPYYWKADYGYRGDWQLRRLVLMVPQFLMGHDQSIILNGILRERNWIAEIYAELEAIKPARSRTTEEEPWGNIEVIAQPDGYRGGPLAVD